MNATARTYESSRYESLFCGAHVCTMYMANRNNPETGYQISAEWKWWNLLMILLCIAKQELRLLA